MTTPTWGYLTITVRGTHQRLADLGDRLARSTGEPVTLATDRTPQHVMLLRPDGSYERLPGRWPHATKQTRPARNFDRNP